MIMKPAIVSQ